MALTLIDYKVLFAKEEEKYSNQTNQSIYEWADLVQKEFLKSPQASKLSPEACQCVYLISLFAEMAYSYHLKKPGHWTEFEVRDICVQLIPQKLIASKETFEFLPDILEAIFLWGEELDIFQDTTSWCQALVASKKNIAINAAGPGHWDLAKSLIMES